MKSVNGVECRKMGGEVAVGRRDTGGEAPTFESGNRSMLRACSASHVKGEWFCRAMYLNRVKVGTKL